MFGIWSFRLSLDEDIIIVKVSDDLGFVFLLYYLNIALTTALRSERGSEDEKT
jgi:hypothetical protein